MSKYDCTKTLDYAHERKRMCDSSNGCDGCKFTEMHCILADDITQNHIDIVQKWSDTHPEKTRKEAFLEIFPKKEIDANVKKYEETTEKNRANGAKGGRPKNPQKPNETQNNRSDFEGTQQNPQKPNETLYDNEYDNDNEYEYDLKKEKDKKKKESKKPFGEFGNVMLTDAEYVKVQERFPLDYDDRIEKLSAYIASTGKKYKDHRATIMNWARRDKEQGKGRDRPGYTAENYTLEACQAKQAEHPEDDDIYEVL